MDEDLFALNVFSVVNLTRVVLPHMLQRWIFVSSFCTLHVGVFLFKLKTQYIFYFCHAMPLQGLWEYCPDVQLCWQSRSSLLWNLHGLKTRLEWC